ncbi:MAG: hypothetical protein JXQ73_23405 [Phycisphaerae bacterium]|nr:hypothetical protein [Phycisphaerae bacterium]
MRHRALVCGGTILVICLFAGLGAAEEIPLRAFSYHEGFEGTCPKLELWATNGSSTVVFSGPSEEQAFEGKRSLKLDVTLDEGSYHYFGVKCPVPCMGKLTLSARVYVADGTTARVGFGTNMRYPPTHHTGCSPAKTFDSPTRDWQRVEIDLVARGINGADSVMGNYTATTRGQDVGAVLDRWSLFILGGKGNRAVVYLDDIRIEGQVPSDADFKKEIDRRWAGGQKRLQGRLDDWRAQVAASKKAFAEPADPPEPVRQYVTAFKKSVAKAQDVIARLAKAGYGSRGDLTEIETALDIVRYGPETIRTMTAGIRAGRPLILYTPPAITNVRFTTDAFPIPGRPGDRLSCSGSRDEYESLSLVLYALEDLKGCRVSCGDLSGPSGTIPSAAVDVHVVKCWYQAGKGIWFSKGTKLLTPELLLKDDGLVRVDLEKKENYVRSTAPDGKEHYLLCSGKTSEGLAEVRPIDAKTLCPVDIPARTLRQYWLTVRIPKDAKPGAYEGQVRIEWQSGGHAIPLTVTAHAFELMPSRLIYSIYYRAKLSPDGKPTIGSEHKSEQQYRAELADFLSHGVLYPTNYQSMDERLLRRVLEMRREAGLPAGKFYHLGTSTGAPKTQQALKDLAGRVQRCIAFCKPFGYDEVYFYGIDEAKGDRLNAQRAAWGAVQESGGKMFVACYKQTFEAMGKLLNCAVLAGRPDPEEARKWHSVGSQAFCYAYPQVGNEEPETYRRHFGLVLWKAGFDGAMDYAYQHGFGHVWNDFDHHHYRDHNFTYPTVDGVVGTIQWEGFREAVDDVRYVATLEHAIQHAPPAKADLAKQARTWLDRLDPDTADLHETRARMVEFISRLRS